MPVCIPLTLCILETPYMGDIANSEDQEEMQHDTAFHQGLPCLLRLQQNATDIKNILDLTTKRAKWNTLYLLHLYVSEKKR